MSRRPNPLMRRTAIAQSVVERRGSPFVTWFTVPRSRFQFVHGEPTWFKSTAKSTRSFCPRCGTRLTFEHEDFSDEIDITRCSLDESDKLSPKDHTHTGSKLSWIRLADRLPEYPESRQTS